MLVLGYLWHLNSKDGFGKGFFNVFDSHEENPFDLVDESEFDSTSLEVEKELADEREPLLGEVPRTCCRPFCAAGRAEMARGLAERVRRKSVESFIAGKRNVIFSHMLLSVHVKRKMC